MVARSGCRAALAHADALRVNGSFGGNIWCTQPQTLPHPQVQILPLIQWLGNMKFLPDVALYQRDNLRAGPIQFYPILLAASNIFAFSLPPVEGGKYVRCQ
jgi:hypothetical protein